MEILMFLEEAVYLLAVLVTVQSACAVHESTAGADHLGGLF